MSVKDNIQVILITYNRVKYLRHTFEQIFADNSPIKDFNITVLDNNSTDETPAFIEEFSRNRPNISYVKNNYNVGMSGNIAKAFEFATGEYFWVLCDDDLYNWEAWPEVEKAISEQIDIICVADHAIKNKLLPEDLLLQLTYLPAGIYKRANVDDTTMRNTFDNIYTLFPHLSLPCDVINQNKSFYVTSKAIVSGHPIEKDNRDCTYVRGSDSSRLALKCKLMTWAIGYLNILSLLKDEKLKEKCINICQSYLNQDFKKFITYYLDNFILEKDYWSGLIDIYVQLSKEQAKIFRLIMIKSFFKALLKKGLKTIKSLTGK